MGISPAKERFGSELQKQEREREREREIELGFGILWFSGGAI